MNIRTNHPLRITSVCFITLLIFLAVLSGLRKLVEIMFWDATSYRSLPYQMTRLTVRVPTLDPTLERESKIQYPGFISMALRDVNAYLTNFALFDQNTYLKYPNNHEIFVKDDTNDKLFRLKKIGRVYFAEEKGLFVFERIPDLRTSPPETETSVTYFGPKGAGETPSSALGGFAEPISTAEPLGTQLIIYDRHTSCFYRLNMSETSVTQGPKLTDNLEYMQLSGIEKNPGIVELHWQPPQVYTEESSDQQEENSASARKIPKIIPLPMNSPLRGGSYWGAFIPVLKGDGTIEKLDVETLKITGTLGHLVGDNKITIVTPRNLLAYNVKPLVYNGEYKGLAVGGLGRNLNQAAIVLFDEGGAITKIEENPDQTRFRPDSLTASYVDLTADIWHRPGGPLYKVTKFLAETLSPLAVNMVSCYTAGKFEAISSRRALFFLSDTYTAQTVLRDDNELTAGLQVIGLSLPAGLLGLFLAWRVSKNARQVGLSRNMQTFWIIMVIFFGIPAYITYRLTRPEMVLVSCRNCGQMRRPDQELCHQCKSPWAIPELVPPAWRVREG